MALARICAGGVQQCASLPRTAPVESSGKTANGERLVPIHPELLRRGLVQHAQASEGERLFPMWSAASRNGPWQNGLKWYAKVMVKVKLDKTLYAARHAFATSLRHLGVAETVVAELMGRAKGRGQSFGRYANRGELAALQAAINKLPVNPDQQAASQPREKMTLQALKEVMKRAGIYYMHHAYRVMHPACAGVFVNYTDLEAAGDAIGAAIQSNGGHDLTKALEPLKVAEYVSDWYVIYWPEITWQ